MSKVIFTLAGTALTIAAVIKADDTIVYAVAGVVFLLFAACIHIMNASAGSPGEQLQSIHGVARVPPRTTRTK